MAPVIERNPLAAQNLIILMPFSGDHHEIGWTGIGDGRLDRRTPVL